MRVDFLYCYLLYIRHTGASRLHRQGVETFVYNTSGMCLRHSDALVNNTLKGQETVVLPPKYTLAAVDSLATHVQASVAPLQCQCG